MARLKKKRRVDWVEEHAGYGELATAHLGTDLVGLDTLNEQRLPPTDNVEVEYCPETYEAETQNAYTVGLIVLMGLLAIAFTLVSRLLTTFFFTGFAFAAVAIGAVAFWFRILISRKAGRLHWAFALTPFLLWFVICHFSLPYGWRCLALLVCLFVAGLLARAIANQYADYLCAQGNIDPERVKYWREYLQSGNARQYSSGIVILGAVLAVTALFWVPQSYFPAYSAGAAKAWYFVVLMLAGWIPVALVSYSKNSGGGFSFLFWKALTHWFTFESHADAAGVYRVKGLWHDAYLRTAAVCLVLVAIGMTLASAACYFPFLVHDGGPWLDASGIPRSTMPLVDQPTPQDVAKNKKYNKDVAELLPVVGAAPGMMSLAEAYPDAIAGQMIERQLGWLRREVLRYRLDHAKWLDAIENSGPRQGSYPGYQIQQGDSLEPIINWFKPAADSIREPQPESWLMLAVRGLGTEHIGYFLWALAVPVIASVVLPITFFYVCGSIASTPVLAAIAADVRRDAEAPTEAALWESRVATMQNSQDSTERDSLWLGVHEYGDYPILAPRRLLREHAHILGDTGSGKTALGLAPMMTQLVRMAGRDKRAGRQPQSSIVVLDLKGDAALFQGMRQEAEEAGLPFKWFTNQYNHSTYVFNPFTQLHMKELAFYQRADVLLHALSLAYGTEFGQSYFGGMNREVFSRALAAFGNAIESFTQIDYVCKPGTRTATGKKFRLTDQHYRDAAHFLTTIETLSRIPALNITNSAPEHAEFSGAAENAIDMANVIREPQVVYFYLKAGIETGIVQDIGRLALFSLLTAAVQKPHAQLGNHQTYVFVDEFQQIVANNLEIILRQARSHGLAAILANQTISDLTTGRDVDLRPTVQANTRLKQYFASSDPNQRDMLVEASGETVYYMADSLEYTDNLKAYIREARYPPNEIIRMTDDPSLSILHISRGEGYAQFGGFPVMMSGSYHITEEEYGRREKLPWPEGDENTVTPTLKDVEDLASVQPNFNAAPPGEEEDVEPTEEQKEPPVNPTVQDMLNQFGRMYPPES